MGQDAMALLRVRSRTLLRERLERGVLGARDVRRLEPLADGNVVWPTLVRFPRSNEDKESLASWLSERLGPDWEAVHDDVRGVFVYPDIIEPQAETYQAIIDELAEVGSWALSPDTLEPPVSPPLSSPAGAVLAWESPLTANAAAERDFSLTCLLVDRSSPLGHEQREQLNDVFVLPDGSHVLVTTTFMASRGSWATQLGEDRTAWLGEHAAQRGVLAFPFSRLDEIKTALNYEAAALLIGAEGEWLVPKSFAQMIAEAEARALAFFDNGPPGGGERD